MRFKTAIFMITSLHLACSSAQAGELIRFYVGSGPSLNTSMSPKIRFLKTPGGEELLGMSSDIQLPSGQHERALVIREQSYLKPALSAYLAAETSDLVLTGTGTLYGLLPEDADYLANALIGQAGSENLVIETLTDCDQAMKYLKDDSSTVYPPAALEVIRHFICN